MAEGIYVIHRGWKFTPPFICMGCGIGIARQQFAFSRSCGSCGHDNSRTRRVFYRQCFAGPHEKLPNHGDHHLDIPEQDFIDPKDREKYPVMFRRRPKPFKPRKVN